jgi:hypothetical protein
VRTVYIRPMPAKRVCVRLVDGETRVLELPAGVSVESAVFHVTGHQRHMELPDEAWLRVRGNNSWIPTRAIVEVWVEDEPDEDAVTELH